MNQNLAYKEERLYCKYCKAMPIINIPENVDLSSPSSEKFVRNVRCTICKNIGYVRR